MRNVVVRCVSSGQGAARRAIAFIEGHPHADISVADIAVASNVSIRAVQSAFRHQLDTTPETTLSRATRVLQVFGPEASSLTASDISRRTGIPLASTHRPVGQMVQLG
ncbi:helix-turn-helix domain-containing protein [Pseudonocardia sp. Cha107L01]|uniref:helix-turn-helix domain-containing protein n=1 Tax=Pseudonocardia sp. Cha107L01 TaxID=3457576 RepID=UPI00403E9A54